jgi:protein-S-isoprenylcysteine O-methyltransferase Ste14
MHLLGARVLGIALLVLWFGEWLLMKMAPGGFSHRNMGRGFIPKAYNILNTFQTVIVTPLVAILLITRTVSPFETTGVRLEAEWLSRLVETLGVVVYLTAHVVVSAGRLALDTSFQVGGIAPRPDDQFITAGIYSVLRHPMYTAVLCFPLGLALLTQSLVLLALSVVLLGLVLALIPIEEKQLEAAHGDAYAAYREKTKALIPFVY